MFFRNAFTKDKSRDIHLIEALLAQKFHTLFRCILRVLDSFGSHAEFNLRPYFTSHKGELGGGPNPWGGHALELQQFMTMYPHTDDNTFLGFVVEMHLVDERIERDNATLVSLDSNFLRYRSLLR